MAQTTPVSFDYGDSLENLITFFKTQEEFKDFDFTGAAIREFLRILAYNSQMRSMLNSFMINELCLSTADIRANAAATAAPLGYVPKSKIGATLPIDLIIDPESNLKGNILQIDKETRFMAIKDGMSYSFCPTETFQIEINSDGKFVKNDLHLKQGDWRRYSYVVQTNMTVEDFMVPTENIDTSTLQVAVFPDPRSKEYNTWNKFESGYDLGKDNKIYYLRENRNGRYSIEFGDGVISARPEFGSIVVIEYMDTEGQAGNGINGIAPVSSIGGYFNVDVVLGDSVRSYGGADQEDIEIIRKMAPRVFAAQGNAVTDDDYIAIVKDVYPEADDVIAYGGEKAEPQRYGYTIVGVKPKNSEFLTDDQKKELFDLIKKYNVGSITPIITDPNYTYIDIDTYIEFNPKLTILSAESLKGKIVSMCKAYSQQYLEKFSSNFNYQHFSTFVNKIDNSILRAVVACKYHKTFKPALGTSGAYSFTFGHEIAAGKTEVTGFRIQDTNFTGYEYKYVDNGNGTMSLIKTDGTTITVIQKNGGTIDYTTGTIKLSQFNPISLPSGYATVSVEPSGVDLSLEATRDAVLQFAMINSDMKVKNARN